MAILSPPTDTKTEAEADASFVQQAKLACQGEDAPKLLQTTLSPAGNIARFEFASGMQAILLPKSSIPQLVYQTWYAVGSCDEPEHMSGLAHLVEHMMFKGSANYPGNIFDTTIQAMGGDSNAATSIDWTYYTQTVASTDDALATIAHMDADRMGRLLLDAKAFASELDVVKNERRTTVDDSVVARMAEALYRRAFEPHPYHRPVIGWMSDLNRCTADDLRTFYQTHYGPNTATVVLVGDFDLANALQTLQQAYSNIRPATRKANIPHLNLHALNRWQACQQITLKPKACGQPQWLVSFCATNVMQADFVALELALETLAGGESSILYEKLVVEECLLASVDASLPPMRQGGILAFGLSLREGVCPSKALKRFQELLQGATNNIPNEALEAARNALELAWWQSMDDGEELAESLGHDHIVLGNFAHNLRGPKRWQNIDKARAQEALKRVFEPNAAVSVLALPPLSPDSPKNSP